MHAVGDPDTSRYVQMAPIGGRNGARYVAANNIQNKANNVASLTLTHLEDLRISKILRRLLAENNAAISVNLCNKLEVAVRSQSNASYICRSFEFLLENMISVLRQCPLECLNQASVVLGLIGYINRADFSFYKTCITKSYQTYKGMRKYLMLALKTTFSCDAVNLDLNIYSERVLVILKDYLENAEIAENFRSVSEAIAEFSKNYKLSFESHFTDIVDIIVGWHLEVEQPQCLKLHCSFVLQQFSQYFLKELDFTVGLLGQFLEDIVAFGEDLVAEGSSQKMKQKAEVRVGSFLGAFNSIIKSLSTRIEFIGFTANQGMDVFREAVAVIIKTAKQTLSTVLASEDTILNINDFLCLIFTSKNYDTVNMKLSDIEEIIAMQLKQFNHFSDHQSRSLLYLIVFIIKQLRNCLPLTLVSLLFQTQQNPLVSIKLTKNILLYKLLLRTYHEVLMIKNVPLLQEAYRHIKMDVDYSIQVLESCESNNSHIIIIAQATLNFYFSALTALATQTSSIIGMYALNPSILDLLIVNCKAANIQLWHKHPTLHNALLNLLIVHCQRNHNYRPTSRLLTNQLSFGAKNSSLVDENNSPTSENFSTILQFLAEIFNCVTDLNRKTLYLILQWVQQLLQECRDNAEILQSNANFIKICKSLSVTAILAPMQSAASIRILLKYAALNIEALEYITNAIVHLLDSVDPEVREVYTVTLGRLPLVVILANSKGNNVILQRENKAYELQQWFRSTTHSAPLRNKYFKPFLHSIEFSSTATDSMASVPATLDELFLSFFDKCWTAQFRESEATDFQQVARVSSRLLESWVQYEAARYCVRNKLRTTVGKPQDTFLAIEAIIMKYARLLTTNINGSPKLTNSQESQSPSLQNSMCIQRKMRVLLGFLECLEKHIYNAAEGTAFAISPLEKPAKTFFRINSPTCMEWLKRIRAAVNLIATHSMELEMVARTSENILRTDKLNDAHMDHTVTSLVNALLHCGESDTLQGLYIWFKSKTGKSFSWIQYAAEQAAGHKEQAAEGYMNFLNENEMKVDSYVKDFLIDQLLNCLYNTGQWSRMREFLQRYEALGQETANYTNWRSSAHLNMMEHICYGYNKAPDNSADITKALYELSEWPSYVNEYAVMENDSSSFSYSNRMRALENACIAQVFKNNSVEFSQDVQAAIHMGLQESLRSGSIVEKNEQLTDFLILNHVSQKCMENEQVDGQINEDQQKFFSAFHCKQMQEQSSTFLTKYLLWALLFIERSHIIDEYKHHTLYLDVAASARREGNGNYCRSMLERFFVLKGFAEPLQSICEDVKSGSYIININDSDLLSGFAELAKCIHVNAANNQLDAVNFASAYCYQIMQQVMMQSNELQQYPHISSDMLRTIADWLAHAQRAGNVSSVANSPQLQRLLGMLPEISMHLMDDTIIPNAIIPSFDRAVGKLLNASIIQNNSSGEAWCAFGNWCYRWGKKLMEAKNAEHNTLRGNLTERDLIAIKEILGASASEELVHQLVYVLNSHELNLNDSVEDIEKSEVSSTEIIEHELRKANTLVENLSVENIANIIKIWRQAHKSVYTYYEMATTAYFKYLAIETVDSEPKASGRRVAECTFVTTTLRLLRLVVKHAIGLQDVLEEGLCTTPLRPWKVIIPQLFSRLNHHEPYVRKSVSELLCRLAQDRPHLIIFPAVVGAQQELKIAEAPQNVDESKDDSSSGNYKSTVLSTCFSSLLSTLSNQAPETVLHVKLLVKELKRITLLWEEYWIHSLAQLYAEYSCLFNTLETETKKKHSDTNSEKLNSKYRIVMKHLVNDLEAVASVTAKEAETNYERNFQDRYDHLINSTIAEMKGSSMPNEACWMRVKQLYGIFQQRAMRGSASTLKIFDLSPVLASMRNTSISMPGVDTFEKHPIHIKSVDNTVYILPTKTKPKKLAFWGSDGRKYTYLFKGLEDLHLDERIMQFLSISNSMMARTTSDLTCNSNANNFKAHHYSVIPLGPQSGLISWVDGVTPLFSIYKKWQQRDVALKQQQKERSTSATVSQHQNSAQLQQQQQQASIPPAATRPSELFYNKLTPLLAEQNMKVSDPRKQWPLGTLRRVLEELTKETPKDLLAKELWCHASNAAEWHKSIRNYSMSVAVMSVIGYVIGLGDRHLDNVLIKLSTGEIIHIDYNVCFEKGKTLRVPEKVPFRMTPNLEEALGITGIEGSFRLGCEHVLKTLRKERETLLTLLEAFVYDPLVDWTISDDSSAAAVTRATSAHAAAISIAALNQLSSMNLLKDSTKISKPGDFVHKQQQQQQDWEYSRHGIEMRCCDLKPYWIKYKDDLELKMMMIEKEIKQLTCLHQRIESEEVERDSLTKQLAMVRELEALGSAMESHALNTITQRYNASKRDVEAYNAAKENFLQYQKHINWFEEYLMRLTAAAPKINELTYLKQQLCEQQQIALANEFEAVRSLFETGDSGGSGVSVGAQETLYSQCDFARKEMDNTLQQASRSAMECLELLLQYSGVVQFCPLLQLHRNRSRRYEDWCRQLLDETPQSGELIRERLQQVIEANAKINELEMSRAMQYSKAMENIWTELNCILHKSINELDNQKQEQEPILPIKVTINDLQSFLATNNELHSQTLQICMLEIIASANEAFLVFEEEALLNNSANDAFLLNQQMNYIDVVQNMFQSVFPESVQQPSYTSIMQLNITLQYLYKIKSTFELSIPDRILRLVIQNNEPDFQSLLEIVCSSLKSSSELLQISKTNASAGVEELIDLLCEIHNIFDEFEKQMKELQQHTQKVMDETTDCNFKQFVNLKYMGSNLSSLNEIWKLEAITQTFRIARNHVDSFCSSNIQTVYDIRLIAAPINDYIHNIQKCFIGGLPSLFVHSLHQGFNSIAQLRNTCIDSVTMANAGSLCQSLFMSLQHNSSVKFYQQQMVLNRKYFEHYTLIASAHFWSNDIPHMYGLARDKLLEGIQRSSQALNVWKHTMMKIQNSIEEYTTAITQHVNWAVDANSNLLCLQDTLMNNVKSQKARYHFYQNLVTLLIEYSDTLTQFDLSPARNSFTVSVKQWQDALMQWQRSAATITPVEQSIVTLLDPEGKIDKCWIENIAGLLDEMTFGVQTKLANLEHEEQKLKDDLYEDAQQLQVLIDDPIRIDMRHLLKAISKMDKSPRAMNSEGATTATRVRELQHALKYFYNKIGELQIQLVARNYSDILTQQFKDKVSEQLIAIQENHKKLASLLQISSTAASSTDGHIKNSENNSGTGGNVNERKAITNNNQYEQKRNAYAVSVWKRIRMKLEGRDPDPNRRSTVAEQVDFIIREAMNPDNLAVLYEGWTPWV